MRRETQNILLLLLGAALLKLAASGDYLRYVKQQHLIWLILAGGVIVLLAGLAVVRDIRGKRHAACGHDHSARSAWMLVVPVLAVLIVAPPALGSDSVARSGALPPPSPRDVPAYPPLPPDEVSSMTLTEFQARARWDDSGSLDDRRVALTGFITTEDDDEYVTRMVLGCCAADAYPVRVRLDHDVDHTDDQWVVVTGQLDATDDDVIPTMSVHDITTTEEPADPYE